MNDEIKTPRVPPVLGLAFGILAVSTASIFIRYAQQDAPSLVIAALRLSFATLVLAPTALTRRRSEIASLKLADWLLMLLSGLFLAFHFGTWITSLEYTSVASSVVLVQTTPLWVAVLAWIFLRERLKASTGIGLAVALTGGVIVGVGNACSLGPAGLVCDSFSRLLEGQALVGNLLALAGAIFVSGYLLIGRRLRARLSLVSYTFIVYGAAAVFLLLSTWIAGQPLLGYPPKAYFFCLVLALVPQLLGHSTFNWALRYLSTAFVSVALLGEPIGSTILAYLILKQPPTAFELVGGGLILAGIVLASRGQK